MPISQQSSVETGFIACLMKLRAISIFYLQQKSICAKYGIIMKIINCSRSLVKRLFIITSSLAD